MEIECNLVDADYQPAMSNRNVLDAIGASADCLLARMSGSGATCFGLFESPRAAATAAATLQVGAPHWWVRATAIASGGAVAAIA